jgi:hypothetical protein
MTIAYTVRGYSSFLGGKRLFAIHVDRPGGSALRSTRLGGPCPLPGEAEGGAEQEAATRAVEDRILPRRRSLRLKMNASGLVRQG